MITAGSGQVTNGSGEERKPEVLHRLLRSSSFQQVLTLDLSHATSLQLAQLTALEHLQQVEKLYLVDTGLVTIDPLVRLTRLRVLDVSQNQLESLDALAHSTLQLRVLHVATNRLCRWPKLHRLQQLQSLDLSCNQLGALPTAWLHEVFPSMLSELFITNNVVDRLSGVLHLSTICSQLEAIGFAQNPIWWQLNAFKLSGTTGTTTSPSKAATMLQFLLAAFFRHSCHVEEQFAQELRQLVTDEWVHEMRQAAARDNEDQLHASLMAVVSPLSSPPPVVGRTMDHTQTAPGIPASVVATNDAPLTQQELSSCPFQDHNSVADAKVDHQHQPPPPSGPNSFSAPASTQVRPLLLHHAASFSLPKDSNDDIWRHRQFQRSAIATTDNYESSFFMQPPTPNHFDKHLDTTSTVLLHKLMTLDHQVHHMRKYVNVWIKREQLTRLHAAQRLQRWFRRRIWHRKWSRRTCPVQSIQANAIKQPKASAEERLQTLEQTCFVLERAASVLWDQMHTIQRDTKASQIQCTWRLARQNRWLQQQLQSQQVHIALLTQRLERLELKAEEAAST